MARKRGLFSTGTSSAVGAGLGGVFGGINAAENINNSRAAREEARRRGEIDRFMAGVKLEELGRPTQVVTFGPDGKPQVNIQQGASPGRLDVLGDIIGLPGHPGGAAAPSSPRVLVPPRPPSSLPESSAQKTARDLLGQTFSAQNKFQDVDEQTANSAVQAGQIVGIPVTKESLKPGGVMGFLGFGKPKFRISIDDRGAEALGGVATPAPSTPAPSVSTASQPAPGARIRVRVKATGETGTIPSEEFDPSIYERA